MFNIINTRRIAYQEATQTFGIISLRIEVLEPGSDRTIPLHPSASTTANNITSSVTTSSAAGSASSGHAVADGITFGDEVEVSSLLIVDQHTFEGWFYEYVIPILYFPCRLDAKFAIFNIVCYL